jgi:hypothetical protein
MKFKDWFIENTLLSEITAKIEKQMDKVYSDPSEFPFKGIFEKVIPDNEEATRFIIPFMNDQIGLSILTKIEAEGYEIDLEKGLITKDKRSIRIGKYILDKKSHDSDIDALKLAEFLDGVKTVISALSTITPENTTDSNGNSLNIIAGNNVLSSYASINSGTLLGGILNLIINYNETINVPSLRYVIFISLLNISLYKAILFSSAMIFAYK